MAGRPEPRWTWPSCNHPEAGRRGLSLGLAGVRGGSPGSCGLIEPADLGRGVDEWSEVCTFSLLMLTSRRRLLVAALSGTLGLVPAAKAGLFPPEGLVNHLLCCGSSFLAAASSHGAAVSLTATGLAEVAPVPGASVLAGGGAARANAPLEEENGFVKLGFDRLASYTFKVPPFDPAATPNVQPPTGEEQIPDWLKKLSGRKVRLTGFMLPLKMEGNKVTEFLLLSDPMMCCYGAVPDMNQWVVVKFKDGVRPLQDVPIDFFGELRVGAMFENGYMTGIYSLEGEKMGEVKG